MMSLRNILIGLTVLLTSLALVTPLDCPEFCKCVVLHDSGPLNHAKCNSLEGLKTEGTNIPLHSIDLSNSSIRRITIHLEKFKDLVSLDLSDNQLSEVGKLGRRIKSLNLSHNKITSGKLSKLPSHLENLDLSYNEITYLPIELKKLHSLRSIELSGNTINCTCETLDVRNWLQENHVWTDNHIKCTYPIDVKGQPWLQVDQSDICGDHVLTPRGMPLKLDMAVEDDNELMLGDQPILNEGSGQGNEDELEKDFLPVDEKKEKKTDDTVDLHVDVEGSGDVFPIVSTDTNGASNVAANVTVSDDVAAPIPEMGSGNNELEDDEQGRIMNADDEGSGSGMGLYIPNIGIGDKDTTSNVQFDEHTTDDDDNYENTPVAPPQEEATQSGSDIFGAGAGIMTSEDVTKSPVVEEAIIASDVYKTGSGVSGDDVDKSIHNDKIEAGQNSKIVVCDVDKADTSSNQNAYILLLIILVLLVVLITYVAVKRRNLNHGREGDAENPRSTELVDMNKVNLGKPINKNGVPEHIPLIGDRSKEDFAKPIHGEKKTPYKPSDEKDSKAKEPLLNNEHSTPESNNNVSPTDAESPVPSPRRQSEHNSEPIRKPNSKTVHPASDDEVFLPSSSPSSPKASRYSPVYSPETGRVKIKLLETPKPKTPLLVTRSGPIAGDVITTPNGDSLGY